MSDEKIIDDMIYDLGIEGLEPRKTSPVMPLAITAGGAALILLSFIGSVRENANLASGLLMCGILLFIAGAIKLATTLGGRGKPYYKPSGEFLKRYELRFDPTQKDRAREMLLDGDFEALAEMPSGETSAVKAVVYKTGDNELAVAQLLEYIPHFYRGATEVRIFRKGEFIRSAKLP